MLLCCDEPCKCPAVGNEFIAVDNGDKKSDVFGHGFATVAVEVVTLPTELVASLALKFIEVDVGFDVDSCCEAVKYGVDIPSCGGKV